MCAVPTSEAEPPEPPEDGAPESEAPDAERLARAGWSEAELTWEHVQEAAAEALAAGDRAGAGDLWQTGLEIARGHLADNDPRLAASLANEALARRHAGDAAEAASLFDEALAVWKRAGPWLAALAPERRARSATYHLRLERRYPGGYERHSRARYAELAEEGRAAVQALKDAKADGAGPSGALARWRKERPAGLCDARKLLAAVLLTADPCT